jgi:hypothetical protein
MKGTFKMKKIRRNYSKLMGREVKYQAKNENTIGIVTAADYSIGITIQEKGTDKYLICNIGPGSPKWLKSYDLKRAQKIQRILHDQIMSGILLPLEIIDAVGEKEKIFSYGPTSSSCPF